MDDQTEPPFPPKPKEESSVTSTVTTESSVIGHPKSDETMIGGASGRFWIAFVLAFGLVALPLGWLVSAALGVTIDATTFGVVYTAYIGAAGVGVGTYIGQAKPKSQT